MSETVNPLSECTNMSTIKYCNRDTKNDQSLSNSITSEHKSPQIENLNEKETYAAALATNVSVVSAENDANLNLPKLPRKRTTSASIYDQQVSKKGRPRSGSINNQDLKYQIFIGDIPGYCTDQMIKDALAKFGTVNTISIFRRSISGPNFGFVTFIDEISATTAVSEGSVKLLNDSAILRIERRKDFSNKHLENLGPLNNPVNSPKRVLSPLSPCKSNFVTFTTPPRLMQAKIDKGANVQGKMKPIVSPPIKLNDRTDVPEIKDGYFYERLKNFDWRKSAAKYLFRSTTMEDYLIQYICAQAAYQQIESENLSSLMERLVLFSNTRPADVTEMMPPSISGLVYNQTTNKEGHQFFDVYEILKLSPSFKIMNNVIHYNHKLSFYESANVLKDILVEGLFIYFFAKFCHGPRFKIKYLYYQRSEPIKSTLIEVTGHSSVPEALVSYFNMFHEIFTFDEKTCDLTLTLDYFDRNHKEKMRSYLDLSSCSKYENLQINLGTTNNRSYNLERSYESIDMKPQIDSNNLTPSNFSEFSSANSTALENSICSPIHDNSDIQRNSTTTNMLSETENSSNGSFRCTSTPFEYKAKLIEISNSEYRNQLGNKRNGNDASFLFDNSSETCNYLPVFNRMGYIHSILNESRAVIVYCPEEKIRGFSDECNTTYAYFKRKDTYIDGKRVTADYSLLDLLTIGDQVRFNAKFVNDTSMQRLINLSKSNKSPRNIIENEINVDAKNCREWICSHVWTGETPTFIRRLLSTKEGDQRVDPFLDFEIQEEHMVFKTLNQCKDEYKAQSTNPLSPTESNSQSMQTNKYEQIEEVAGPDIKQIFNDLRGTIASVNSSSGYIRFAMDADYGYQDAYFIPDVLWFEGRQTSQNSDLFTFPRNINNLHQIVKEGCEVILDVEKQVSGNSVKFRAFNVRIPRKNTSTQIKCTNELPRQVALDVEEFLEPLEVLQRIKVDPIKVEDISSKSFENARCLQDKSYYEPFADLTSKSSGVPESVTSVVYGALREDDGHNILSNPWAIEALLNKLEHISMQQKQQIMSPEKEGKTKLFPRIERDNLKMKIETEVRKIVSKFVKDHQ